jgi:hypothetical protein
MVFDHAHEHRSQWATIDPSPISSDASSKRCGVVRQVERDGGKRAGLTLTDERARLK